MKKNFFRKVAFGLSPSEKINEDPLSWAKKQFDTVPEFVWEKRLPNLQEQRNRYGKWVYEDREVLREKYKNDRLAYEKEKDNLRAITGEEFFEPLELSVRHSTALASNSPAFERMWHFWGNFFAISEKDYLASFSTGVYQREIIRPNLVNSFEDLVYSVTTSWCMLHHLDNAENIGPNSREGVRENSDNDNEKVGLNENHARELLELHTLSPDGKYTQKDVIEMAKVMTGWRYLWNNKKLEAGPIKFQPEYHEQGPYKILGKIYDIKDFNTVNQGKELGIVIKDLSNHPATIRHVARKLCQHYISDEPTEEMIASIVKTWKQNDGNLIEVHKSTMEAVFNYGSNYQKFSMPELWLLQNSRMLGLNYLYMFPKGFEFNGSRPSRSHRMVKDILWEIGHPIYRAKQPNGFIDLEDEWLSPELIIRRLAAARRFADITNPNVSYDQDYFLNVIEKNFDQPENLLNLMKDKVFYADRFAIFANSPEVMRV